MNEKEIEQTEEELYNAVRANDNQSIIKFLRELDEVDGYYDDSTMLRVAARRLRQNYQKEIVT